MKLSANLGFLWQELELCDAIRAAGAAGFDAVEVHWPYITHALDVALTLEETGLPLLSLNTTPGNLAAGDFGLAAVPGREAEAQSAIDKALSYAADVAARWVHVLSGLAEGVQADATFVANMRYAASRGREFGVGILIEPMAAAAKPGYFLNDFAQAADLIDRIGEPNVKVLLDCYHAASADQEPLAVVRYLGERLGHIQFSSIPDRAEPDHGHVDYVELLPQLVAAGYTGYFGAEYHPTTRTDNSLDWMEMFR